MKTLNRILTIGSIMLTSACATQSAYLMKVDTPEMPLIRAALFFPFGSGDETPGTEGETLLVARWLDFGTEHLDMAAYNQAALGLGAAIDTSIYPRFTLVTVEAPRDSFAKAWDLAIEKVRHPRLKDADLETVRAGMLSMKKSRLTGWAMAGKQLGTAAIYAGTPDAHSEVGKESVLKTASAQTLKGFYSATFAKGPAAVLASKSMDQASEVLIRHSLEGWTNRFHKASPKPHEVKGRNLLIVDRPGSTQTYLFFAKGGPTPGTDEHALASIGTQLLGSNGGNSSILFDELRAKRGLTYHASIQTSKGPNKQILLGVTFGSNEKIADLADLYLSKWKKFYDRTDIPLADLKEADIAYRAKRERDNGETIGGLIETAAQTFSVTGKVVPIWRKPEITVDSFNEAKKRWMEPDNFTLVVLGDSSKVRTPLEKALGSVASTTILPAESDWDAVSEAVAKH